MAACKRTTIAIVTSANNTCQRDAGRYAGVDDVAIALVQPGVGKLQVPELVSLIRVDASVVEHELWREGLEDAGQSVS